MKADERTISNVLIEDHHYVIPPYQRPYSWEKENVQQLLDDTWESFEVDDDEYFIGSLITILRKGSEKRYEVVDGQQRLTTLNLLFCRLRDKLNVQTAKADLGQRVFPVDPYTNEAAEPRLRLRSQDQPFFRRYALEAAPLPEDMKEYDQPKQRIAENLETIDAFLSDKTDNQLARYSKFLLSKVFVVFVMTESFKSAYRLFNVLNARGMPLSNADLIKNSLFDLLGSTNSVSQGQELEERWEELEGTVGIDRLDTFLGTHRTTLKADKQRKSLSEEMKPIINSHEGGPFGFLDAAIDSAKNFQRIDEENLSDDCIRPLRSLRRVRYDEWIAPLLTFLNNPINGITVGEFVGSLERITMQNWVRRLGRGARLTVYFQLINAIKSGRNADDLRAIFVKNANNEEFISLLDGDIYGQPFCMAVLLRLEDSCQDESVNKSYNGRLTIEHVLPQALKDDYWKARFNEEDHRRWIHKLGNLTPLAGNKNYKAQYFSFDRKKKTYSQRNSKVSFDLTKEVVDEADWTVEKISTRHKQLIETAKKIWCIQ